MTEEIVKDSRSNLITREEMRRYTNAGTQADPIGTIKAWHKAGLGGIAAPALTDGWEECNGQTLSDIDSIWDGETMPNLNAGQARFLRGSATSGTEQAETTSASDLGMSGSDGTHIHRLDVRAVDTSGADILSNVAQSGTADFDVDNSVIAALSGHGHTITGSSETRPINMSVVWIMRIK